MLSAAILLTGVLTFAPESMAAADNHFSQPYGLIVHNVNRDRVVPRVKALEVLLKFYDKVKPISDRVINVEFEDIKEGTAFHNYVNKGCQLRLFDCNQKLFKPGEGITQRDFLDWFFTLKYYDQPSFLRKKYPLLREDHMRNWLQARGLNLLVGVEITYKTLQQMLYRNMVVVTNFNQPYLPGLPTSFEDVTPENYHNLNEVDVILKNLNRVILSFKKGQLLSRQESKYLKSLGVRYDAFLNVKSQLLERSYILQMRPDFDPEITQAIRENNLQEVLYRYSYDYGENAAYRKHNLTTGVMKFHGKVFQPDEVIDFWKVISDRNLYDFEYGWVIAQGESKWQFGGGICGSSSMVFLPAWKSGLEILERRSHSQYYSNLYPMEDIGLDATMYRPAPNLRIRNNTKSPLLFNVMNDKENEIIVIEIIGNSPYKSIEIEGPIFLSPRHVKWIRHLEDFDGKITSEVLESRYNIIY